MRPFTGELDVHAGYLHRIAKSLNLLILVYNSRFQIITMKFPDEKRFAPVHTFTMGETLFL